MPAEVDGHGERQRIQETFGITMAGQRLAITEMGVHVHVADLSAEEAGTLRPLEIHLRTAAVCRRTVEQMRAIRASEVLADQFQMRLGLLRVEHVVDDGMDHRQQAVGQAGRSIAWMQQVFRFSIFMKPCQAGHRSIHDERVLELLQNGCCRVLELRRARILAEPTEGRSQRGESLVVERDGPRTAETVAHFRPGGLQ